MLLALKIWCIVILGFVAISLIVGSVTSRRHAEAGSKWKPLAKELFHPTQLLQHRHHRKAA